MGRDLPRANAARVEIKDRRATLTFVVDTAADSSDDSRDRIARSVLFALIVALTLAMSWTSLTTLLRLSFREEQYSHILLIPLISGFLFYLDGRRIFRCLATQWPVGFGVLSAGFFFYWLRLHHSASLSENDRLAMAV